MDAKTRAKVDRVVLIGAQMANLCFNLSQRPDEPVSKRNADMMRRLQNEWDEAVCELPKRRKVAKV